MRATGLFFRTDAGTFLVTARHNVLPTEYSYTNPDGESTQLFSTDLTLPEVDAFVGSDGDFDHYHYDIREADVRQTPEIDVIGVRIDFDPESYGYQVWEKTDLVRDSSDVRSLDVIGFDGESFPDEEREYNRAMYRQSIGKPRVLNLENPLCDTDASGAGLESVAIDNADEGGYRGLSGSPVVGDKLAGIHIADTGGGSPKEIHKGIRRTVYIRATVLPKLLG